MSHPKKSNHRRRPHSEAQLDSEAQLNSEAQAKETKKHAHDPRKKTANIEEPVEVSEDGETIEVHAETISTEHTHQAHVDYSQEAEAPPEDFHLNFYGSDLIRLKAPKAMEVADLVAKEWIDDGDFQGLPVGNPFVQFMAGRGLRKAKDVEKKLEEKGVITLAKMGIELVRSKIKGE